MRYDAWLMLEGGKAVRVRTVRCLGQGARINVHDSDVIPDDFLLLLAENGTARRRCRVIWRKPRQLGVKFETWLDERVRAAKAPKLKTADVASKEAEATDGRA